MTAPLVPLADRIALREDEAAAMLGISESELARLRLRGVVPRIEGLGRLVRYSPESLRAWALERSGYAGAVEVDGGQEDALRTQHPNFLLRRDAQRLLPRSANPRGGTASRHQMPPNRSTRSLQSA